MFPSQSHVRHIAELLHSVVGTKLRITEHQQAASCLARIHCHLPTSLSVLKAHYLNVN